MLCYVMLPHFMCKIWCSKRVKSYALLCCVMICYADLFYEQNPMLSMSKILWSVMLCLWWHELKSKILWYVMLVLFVSKILCSVMNLTIYWAFGYSDTVQLHHSASTSNRIKEATHSIAHYNLSHWVKILSNNAFSFFCFPQENHYCNFIAKLGRKKYKCTEVIF